MQTIIKCIFINMWFISSSCELLIHVDKTIMRQISNNSKYLYHTADMNNTTPVIDICNESAIEHSVVTFRKRSLEYLITTETSEEIDLSILSPEFKNCTHTSVETECYENLPNGSVYVPLYRRLFDKRNYMIKEGLLFVCPNFFDTEEEKFSSKIEIISLVGISISTLCIILHICMFFCVEKLRNLLGFCLFSLCISLLIAYICAFIQTALHEQANCKVIGMILLYSFLSSFFWMNVISFDVWRAIYISIAKFRRSSDTNMILRFGFYSAYAWGASVLIIIIALITDSASSKIEYKLVFRVTTCWFQYKQALLVYFVLPLLILLIVNIFFFIFSFYMITRTKVKRSDCGSQARSDLWSRLLLSLRLGTAMGLMWLFGVIAAVTELEWIYYLHAVCNALQGVFIFFSFTLNDRARKACSKVIEQKKISILPKLPEQTTAL